LKDKDGSQVEALAGFTTANAQWLWRGCDYWESEGHLIIRWLKPDNQGNLAQEGNDYLDPENKYAGSSLNKAGILLISHSSTEFVYADNTEIWKSS
jgi:hypothetical protein